VMHSAIGQWPDNCTIMGYAVRSDRYRYVAWYKGDYETRTNFDESAIEVEEFYNYEKDPLERKNLAKEPDYREIKREMKNFIKATVFGEF